MTIAFVLAGGGSLGAVQVGMLQALGARGIEPDLLVGTSAGAVNAAWVAGHGMSAESLEELAAVWSSLRRRDLFPVSTVHLMRALCGADTAACSNDRLRQLVETHTRVQELDHAAVPVHLVATDLLSGQAVILSSGSLSAAVLASAAVPGLLPPVAHDGRFLVDGGVADGTGVSVAVELGAQVVYVLPGGSACALPHPPHSAVGVALHALTLLLQRRLTEDIRAWRGAALVKVMPPLCPLAVSPADFAHGAELVTRGREASLDWLDIGGTERRGQERFLSLHDHRPSSVAAEATTCGGRSVD